MKRLAAIIVGVWLFVGSAAAQLIDLGTYYVDAVGKKKEALKNAMHDIIGQADVLKYGSGQDKTWYGFYQTDRMDGDEVRDRYSNDHHYFNNASPYAAVSGMNIEHSFPKSWWGGSNNQAYKDIHHLMPCESRINSSKSNYGMGKVLNASSDNGCTKVGKGPGPEGTTITLWEPADRWKGDFARTVFYMVTCYQNLTWEGTEALYSLTNTDWPTLQPWAYELYLQWAQDDPVDDIERQRNEAVYSIQHNRNPFIDFPELAEYIWGDRTEEAFSIDGTLPPTPPVTGDSILVLLQNFKTAGAGQFRTVNADGSQTTIWQPDSKYGMVANAYNAGKVADVWCISPAIDLTGMQGAVLEFTHAVGYHNGADPADMFEVVVADNFVQIPAEADWKRLEVQWPQEMQTPTSKFTKFVPAGSISLDDYAGQVVNIAFHYTSTSDSCWAWEIGSCQVKAKQLPTGIDQNYMSPVVAEDAVFDISGHYVGPTVPTQRGIYIVRQGGYTYKRFVK